VPEAEKCKRHPSAARLHANRKSPPRGAAKHAEKETGNKGLQGAMHACRPPDSSKLTIVHCIHIKYVVI
jgi:hypothetical protein